MQKKLNTLAKGENFRRRLIARREQSFHNSRTWLGVLSDVNVSHNMCNDKNPTPFKATYSEEEGEILSLFIWKL